MRQDVYSKITAYIRELAIEMAVEDMRKEAEADEAAFSRLRTAHQVPCVASQPAPEPRVCECHNPHMGFRLEPPPVGSGCVPLRPLAIPSARHRHPLNTRRRRSWTRTVDGKKLRTSGERLRRLPTSCGRKHRAWKT